jgi:hypothetical protein
MMKNGNLHSAKSAKNDEFYSQLVDIAKEVMRYKEHFRGKTVYCNCDDPLESNFFKFFAQNFNHFGLKKLISTSYYGSPIAGKGMADLYNGHKGPVKIEITESEDGDFNLRALLEKGKNTVTPLKGSGDFRSVECIEILQEADIVVTNPPFSLFREFVAQLVNYNKKFLIIGSKNAITYKEIFPLIKDGKLWLGVTSPKKFEVPAKEEYISRPSTYSEGGKYYSNFGNIGWFTNLDHSKRHDPLDLCNHYYGNEDAYPQYDNYDAINVDRVKDIPCDYYKIVGVPISFLDKWNKDQFELVCFDYEIKMGLFPELIKPGWTGKLNRGFIDGKCKYARILIRRKEAPKTK